MTAGGGRARERWPRPLRGGSFSDDGSGGTALRRAGVGVRDVLADQKIARIPLAPPEVAGNLNLRGRIVTAIDLRAAAYGCRPREPGARRCRSSRNRAANSMLCWWTRLREVVSLGRSDSGAKPANAAGVWAEHSREFTAWTSACWWCSTSPGCWRSICRDGRLMAPTCLVVDDSRVVRLVARRILEANGFEVREAENGAAGARCLPPALPDASCWTGTCR